MTLINQIRITRWIVNSVFHHVITVLGESSCSDLFHCRGELTLMVTRPLQNTGLVLWTLIGLWWVDLLGRHMGLPQINWTKRALYRQWLLGTTLNVARLEVVWLWFLKRCMFTSLWCMTWLQNILHVLRYVDRWQTLLLLFYWLLLLSLFINPCERRVL